MIFREDRLEIVPVPRKGFKGVFYCDGEKNVLYDRLYSFVQNYHKNNNNNSRNEYAVKMRTQPANALLNVHPVHNRQISLIQTKGCCPAKRGREREADSDNKTKYISIPPYSTNTTASVPSRDRILSGSVIAFEVVSLSQETSDLFLLFFPSHLSTDNDRRQA